MNKEPSDNKYGVKFSELHAIDLIDMDGDGMKDIVTGKRFWSHGRTGDPDRNMAAVLYWFKLVRGADHSVDFIPYLIDNNSGVGTASGCQRYQRRRPCRILWWATRKALSFICTEKEASKEQWEKAQPKPLATTTASSSRRTRRTSGWLV